jgi:hypothetical protein
MIVVTVPRLPLCWQAVVIPTTYTRFTFIDALSSTGLLRGASVSARSR